MGGIDRPPTDQSKKAAFLVIDERRFSMLVHHCWQELGLVFLVAQSSDKRFASQWHLNGHEV